MKILIAEDSDVVRRMLEAAARNAGHEVTSVADGVAAWDTVGTMKPEVVILDWQLPGLDGVEVSRRIRADAELKHTFVLMVTARESGDDIAHALASGVDDYFSKPMSPAHLRARLQIAQQRIAQGRAQRQAEQALAHARWLAGIGETTLALQHELNNPLFALLGHAEILDMETPPSAAHRPTVAIIVEQARRIAAVVRRLSALRNPHSVSGIDNTLMIDLSNDVVGSAPAAK